MCVCVNLEVAYIYIYIYTYLTSGTLKVSWRDGPEGACIMTYKFLILSFITTAFSRSLEGLSRKDPWILLLDPTCEVCVYILLEMQPTI